MFSHPSLLTMRVNCLHSPSAGQFKGNFPEVFLFDSSIIFYLLFSPFCTVTENADYLIHCAIKQDAMTEVKYVLNFISKLSIKLKLINHCFFLL